MNIVQRMFEQGVFKRRYTGIIEIYPRKASNSQAFEAALFEISKTHDLYRITTDYLRAFERKVV